jgi:VWFA-related protein
MILASAGSFMVPLLADNPQAVEEPYLLRSESKLVLLDVSVKNREGIFVSGLTKENFRVFEDGRLQPLTIFDRNDLPVTVGILVDESQSMAGKRNEVLTAAGVFISDSNHRDEIFVINFNDRVMPGLVSQKLFSDDADELRAALYRGVPRGRTALNDAIISGLKQLKLGSRDKKALVVISDGGDNASQHKTAEMFEMVDRSTATIYTIGLFDSDDPERNPAVLRRLAVNSGGEAFFPRSSSQMRPVCHRIAQDMRARYTLGYIPPAGRGDLRRVRVQVQAPGRSGLIATTRKSYHYEDSGNR